MSFIALSDIEIQEAFEVASGLPLATLVVHGRAQETITDEDIVWVPGAVRNPREAFR